MRIGGCGKGRGVKRKGMYIEEIYSYPQFSSWIPLGVLIILGSSYYGRYNLLMVKRLGYKKGWEEIEFFEYGGY